MENPEAAIDTIQDLLYDLHDAGHDFVIQSRAVFVYNVMQQDDSGNYLLVGVFGIP